MKIDEGFSSFSEIANKNKYINIDLASGKDKTVHPFQDLCVQIIQIFKLSKKDQGLVWALWKRRGYPALYETLSKARQGEIKDPIPYLKMMLRK